MPGARMRSLLSYVEGGGRVCPTPGPWERLRQLLGPDSPKIAVLGGWYVVPAVFKALILRSQIEYAAEHNKLAQVDRYLRSLSAREWFRLPAPHAKREREQPRGQLPLPF